VLRERASIVLCGQRALCARPARRVVGREPAGLLGEAIESARGVLYEARDRTRARPREIGLQRDRGGKQVRRADLERRCL